MDPSGTGGKRETKRHGWIVGCALLAAWIWSTSHGADGPPSGVEDSAPGAVYLPLFPLDIVVFPDELLFLRIFEPRYKQLISESATDGVPFGIVSVVDGALAGVGTKVELDRILTTFESGDMAISVRGVAAFHLRAFQAVSRGKLYPGGLVSFIENDPSADRSIQEALVGRYNRARHATDGQALGAPYPENLSFFLGHDLGLTRSEKLQLLATPTERQRQSLLLEHLSEAP